ncbi:MCP four helix bundle domain-containing protein [Pedobacter nutrimenti]|uniref:Chemoreceptor-like protein with four helix bundle sensory module n=1 Tax=Pedobacter nutrimenti TaxID=1241337 RepID=A0A318U819_9SPHI|nr:MCP four helix bundle domain-containing protein [Pedobacter nutrimenti]PYF68982.1 chemoreceptor-like protein with four helix bundle sensory module [Pedobacter nutrimenti]
MKFAYSVKQKMTIALLLFCIMGCSILIRVLEDKSIKKMNNAFLSMYKDRLIPATDLFFLAENIYEKRFLLEETLNQPGLDKARISQTSNRLENHDRNIDSLIRKYEQTLLVKPEKKYLTDLKSKLQAHRLIEQNILVMSSKHSAQEGKKMFETLGKTSFQTATQKLSELTRIQTEVGEELIGNSKFMVSGSQIYSALQVALAIVIGILIVGIVFTSNVVKIQNDKFNLN